MTKDERDLLLKDLSARVPYGVKFKFKYSEIFSETIKGISIFYDIIVCSKDNSCLIDDIKPYLFPISSITKEQKEDMIKFSCGIGSNKNVFDWFNKNHIDYRGLIEKDLALDATGLNIY